MESNLESVPSHNADENENESMDNDEDEPAAKKLCLKQSYVSQSDDGECSLPATSTMKLEKRLSTVLCCTVCLDLPFSTIFQVLIRYTCNCCIFCGREIRNRPQHYFLQN